MTLQELNSKKTPIIPFDRRLEELSKKILAPKKLEEANKLIAKYGVPKTLKQLKTS